MICFNLNAFSLLLSGFIRLDLLIASHLRRFDDGVSMNGFTVP